MPKSTVKTTMANDSDTRLEIAWDAETQRWELRRFSWGVGIGWYRQQTFTLTAAEARQLLRTVRTRAHSHPESNRAKVLPFSPRHVSPCMPAQHTA